MFKNLTKTQIIIIALFFLVIVGAAIFLTIRNQNQKGLNLKTGLPTSLTKSSVESPVLSSNGQKILYFDLSEKKFKQYVIAAKITSNFSDKTFSDVFAVNWSPDRNSAIIIAPQKLFFDFSSGTSKNIDTNINNLFWSKWDNQIVYSYPNSTDRNIEDIFTAKSDGTNIAKITQIKNFGAPLTLNWPTQDTIEIFKSFYNPPETYLTETEQSSFLLSFNLTTGKTTDEKIDKDIADISFSPNGNLFAINKLESDGTFRIKDQSGYHIIKCPMDSSRSLVWSNDNKFLISFVVNNSGSAVSINKIDLSSYNSQKLLDFNNTKKTKIEFAENGMIYNNGQLLFFTDKKTLYGIKTSN